MYQKQDIKKTNSKKDILEIERFSDEELRDLKNDKRIQEGLLRLEEIFK